MADGAHLVGHSYGGLGAMLAAARRPEATQSLTLMEPPAAVPTVLVPSWDSLEHEVRDLWDQDLPDDEMLVRFLRAVGSDPDQFPAGALAEMVPMVPVFRRGRPAFTFEAPIDALAAASFPKLVISGGHSVAFDTMGDVLAQRIGGTHVVVAGAGHEIQFTGEPANQALLTLWRQSDRGG